MLPPRMVPPPPKKWSVDTSRWPVVVVTQHAHQLTDEERLQALAESASALDVAGGPYAIVLDNRSAGPVSPTQRAIIAEHMRLHAPRTSARCAGTALVFESPVLRGALTAILWLRPPVTVTKVFGSLDEAITWARERLDARMLGPGSNPHLSAFPGKR